MTQAERRLYLIRSLLNEKTEYQSLNVPRDAGEQRKLLRSLMNVRMPKVADEAFLRVQDEYLRQELADEGITDLDDLRPVSGDLYLWQGDITRLKCGAIVNAANSGMTGCYIPCHACIDNCIHTFAGVQLRQDCAALMAEQGHEEQTGQAKITKAYNLPCDYVLHTVGPIVSGRVTREDERLLASCYRFCLELAEKNSVRSIAFCCISTGVFHFPNERAAEIAVETVRRYKVETGSKIKVGFRTQETLLGNYTDSRGKTKLVVACRDFTEGGKRLIEFAHLKNTCINSEQNGYGKELSSILEAIEEQSIYPSDELWQFFWDMFIADAFLGNFDRHNGNWGFLVDEEKQQAELAPVYDCGSCLYPQLDLERMKNVLQDEAEIDQRIYTFPTSSIEEGGKKISYFDYISSLKNPDCNEALKRVCSRIDLDAIHNFLEGVPELLPIQREFYLTMLTERKEKILDYSLELLMEQEQHTSPTLGM